MKADEHFKNGKLQDAIDAQIQDVKSDPANQNKRVFLFELLAFAGDWEKAKRQADAIKFAEIELENAIQQYRQVLDAEEKRRRLFTDSQKPKFLAAPPEHVQMRLEAINRMRENNTAEAAALLTKANEAVEPVKGILNGKPFTHMRDTDDLFGSVLEVIAHGEYFWVPLEQLDGMAKNPPKTPRDLIWAPAKLEMQDSTGDVFMPTLYPKSWEHEDDQVKLGRMTDFTEYENDTLLLCKGLRTFVVDDQTVNLLECLDLQLG